MRCIRLTYNTVYLVETGGARVLIDTGPDYRGSGEQRNAALDGRLPELVVATHGHIDHTGLGAWWQSRGVPVALPAADLPLTRPGGIASQTDMERYASYARGCGAPDQVVAAAIEVLETRRSAALRAQDDDAYPEVRRGRWPSGLRYQPFEADALEAKALPEELRVVLCPGHTPGNVVIFEEREGWLFSGDQLLESVTPTPAVQFDAGTGERLRSLPMFVEGLRTLAVLPISRCFPGHGTPFERAAAAIAGDTAQIEARTERAARSLRSHGPATVYELAARLYPRALEKRFWQLISTVQGHLDLLEQDARATILDGQYATTN